MKIIYFKRMLLASLLAGVCMLPAFTCNGPGWDGMSYGVYDSYYEDVWYEETYYYDDYYDDWSFDVWFDDLW